METIQLKRVSDGFIQSFLPLEARELLKRNSEFEVVEVKKVEVKKDEAKK